MNDEPAARGSSTPLGREPTEPSSDHAPAPGAPSAVSSTSTPVREPSAAVPSSELSALFRDADGGCGDDDPRASLGPRPGDVVGRFVLLRTVGEGGFGRVFEAEDLELGRKVALKLLRPQLGAQAGDEQKRVALFRREAQTAAKLKHPNIMTLFDAGSEGAVPYLVLELLEGEALSERLLRERLRPEEAIDVMTSVARGLAHAHASGVIHRDLKPSNVYLCADGIVKILDLGLARVVDIFEPAGPDAPADASRGQTLLSGAGTPAYMAPEQWRRERQDGRTDVFACGVILYELLVGERPWKSSIDEGRPSEEALRARLQPFPAPLAALVMGMLSEAPSARPPTMDRVLAELLYLRAKLWPDPRALARRRRDLLIGAGLVALVGVAAFAMPWLGPDAQPPSAPRPPPSHRQITFHGDAASPELSPDGEVVAYVHDRKVWFHDLRSNQAVPVLSGESFMGLRWAPDGSELRVLSFQNARASGHAVTWPQKEVRPVSDYSRVQAFSPDGRELVISGSGNQLEVWGVTGAKGRALTMPRDVKYVTDVDWGSLGRVAALVLYADHQAIHLVDSTTGAVSLLLSGGARISSPRFGPGGEALYFLREAGSMRELHRLAVGHAAEAPVLPEAILSGLPLGERISISRDGRRLACTRVARFSQIATSHLPPSAEGPAELSTRSLTRGTARLAIPRLSPDGRSIAYASGERPTAELFVMPTTGGKARQVTHGAGSIESIAWSPDGRSFALVIDEGHGRSLQIIDASTGTRRKLPVEGALADMNAQLDWSARGVAYVLLGETWPRIIDPATGQRSVHLEAFAPKGFYFSPRFSPDGRRLAVYANYDRGNLGVRIFDLEAGTSRLIEPRRALMPLAWSADNRSIIVAALPPEPQEGVDHLEQRSAVDGRLECTWRFPMDKQAVDADVDARRGRIVATLEDMRSDVWIVEGFDGAAAQ